MASRYKVIVDRPADWKWQIDGIQVLTAEEYLTGRNEPQKRPVRIINLCRHYNYLSGGYYCSLLAEARNDIPMPTVADIVDLSRRSLYAFALPELELLLKKTVARLTEPPEEACNLYIFFGYAEDTHFRKLAAEVFDIFRYPLLKLVVDPSKQWRIQSIRPMGLHQITAALAPAFEKALRDFTRIYRKKKTDSRKPALYDLAILHNPNEKMAPSNHEALERFVQAGQALRVDVELIQQRDYARITEFDALFIRETTAIDNHTFRFARKAEVEGMPVIDDPKSIMRCTNKVYMWERLKKHHLPTPKTIPLDRCTFVPELITGLEAVLGYPMVLKIPDGSFSRGMFKAKDRAEVAKAAATLFERSRLILAQEFMYTAYDWRIGVLNGKPLYASQYKAARGHWQVINHRDDGTSVAGGFRTFPIHEVPQIILDTAVGAASLIGDGLYGVDIKENDRGVFVIEINDNPNIDYGIEDKVLKRELYSEIILDFIRRIEAKRIG